MTYGDARAFRAALEERLRRQARATGRPLDRVRKEAAAQRLLARLAAVAPEGSWVLKGGLALVVRMGDRARATRDTDATWRAGADALQATLDDVVDLDADDWFRFEIARGRELVAEGPEGGLRFPVVSRLDGRTFEPLTLDVNLMPDDPRPAEAIVLPNVFEFAGFKPVVVPIVPPAQHLAEKLHAYVRTYGEANSRAKDLYDMLAIVGTLPLPSAVDLMAACRQTFELRATEWPPPLSQPPSAWAGAWQGFVDTYGIRWRSLDDAFTALEAFWAPVFDWRDGQWNATRWAWL